MQAKKIVVLISGSGSNLQAMIDAQSNGTLQGEIVAVISNKANAFGLERAQQAGISTHVIEHINFTSREAFDQQVAWQIEQYQPSLVVLAGFMRILSAAFVKRFHLKLLNIHPSLLPNYPGLHTHRKALQNRDEFHGSSVHLVTEELDGGPVVAQIKMSLVHSDSESQVIEKVLKLEHQLYPQVITWFLTDRLNATNTGIYFEGKKLESPIIINSGNETD